MPLTNPSTVSTDEAQSTYLTSTEVARRLGVSNTTVFKWIRSGKLPTPRKSGMCYRHRLSDIYQATVGLSLRCSDDFYEEAKAFVDIYPL